MSELAGEVRRRTVSGVRGVLVLNLAAMPLSFATNMILGRLSPESLGTYGAIQLFLGGYFVFLFPGGVAVFNRFVPSLAPARRLGFLVSYSVLAFAIFAAAAVLPALMAPGIAGAVLAPFGGPPVPAALAFLLVSLVWGLACYFLYSLHRPIEASGAEKLVVLGFFLAAGQAWLSRRAGSDWLWTASVAVYGAGAAVAVWLLARTPEFRGREGPLLGLPSGFGRVAAFAQAEVIVSFVYASLAPYVVLLWMDLQQLGYLHAALRYVALATVVPTAVASALAPGLSRLEAAGLREDSCRQVAAAVRGSLLVLAPLAVGLAAFAPSAMAVFGPEFPAHADLLRFAAPGILAGPVVLYGNALAVATGEFEAWLAASLVYVALALGLTAIAVPALGLPGAALAVAGGSLLRQELVLGTLRRRVGLPRPPRIVAAWSATLAVAAAGTAWRPGPLGAAALWAAGMVAFVALARVGPGEVGAELRRLTGRS